MTLEEAFIDFTNSEEFKETAKKKDVIGNRFRKNLMRFRNGTLGKAAIIELLEANGYVIYADKVEKRNHS